MPCADDDLPDSDEFRRRLQEVTDAAFAEAFPPAPPLPELTLAQLADNVAALQKAQRERYLDDVMLEATSEGRYHVDDRGRPHLMVTPLEFEQLRRSMPPPVLGANVGLDAVLGTPIYVGECPCVIAERAGLDLEPEQLSPLSPPARAFVDHLIDLETRRRRRIEIATDLILIFATAAVLFLLAAAIAEAMR